MLEKQTKRSENFSTYSTFKYAVKINYNEVMTTRDNYSIKSARLDKGQSAFFADLYQGLIYLNQTINWEEENKRGVDIQPLFLSCYILGP